MGAIGRGVRVLVPLVAGVLVGVVALVSLPARDDGTAADAVPTTTLHARPGPGAGSVGSPAPGRPLRLRVPRIGVDTRLMRLGLDADRALEVPPMSRADTAGWYERSPVPGDVGPSVLAGHVDSDDGPAVFYRLRELRRGDRVVVDRSDGRRVTFTVTRVTEVAKAAFPTRRVYGDTPSPELRLITCGGTFDAAADGYLANVVVFARLTHLTA